MQSTQTPTLVPLAWAANGTKNTIPEASQISITPGAASLNDGFPPICAIKVAAGGIAPAYGDFNGIFNLITQSIRWAHAGGRYTWNSTFTTDTNVGGYPNGALLMRSDLTGFWLNTADNNETNPDATDGSAANWVPGYNYGVTALSGLTNANVTLTPAQAAKNKITLAGALSGNLQIIFPTWTKEWEVVNNTTGTYTITAKTASGTGVALAAGQQKITGDGTNITQPPESVAAATLGTHPAQLQQVGHGQCRLTMTSATQLTLVPRNGNNLIINGVPQQIPAGGVTLANTGLAATTFYYIYAYMNSGVMTLEASTTGHFTGTNGVEIKTGDATRTLVGAVYTNGSSPGQFTDSTTARYTLSWFNRRKLNMALSGSVGAFTNTGSVTELDTTKRLFWINWSDEAIKLNLSGQCINANSGYDVILTGGLDNGTVVTNQSGGTIVTGGYSMGFACDTEINASEGSGHILQLLGRVGGGSGSLVGLGMSASTMG